MFPEVVSQFVFFADLGCEGEWVYLSGRYAPQQFRSLKAVSVSPWMGLLLVRVSQGPQSARLVFRFMMRHH